MTTFRRLLICLVKLAALFLTSSWKAVRSLAGLEYVDNRQDWPALQHGRPLTCIRLGRQLQPLQNLLEEPFPCEHVLNYAGPSCRTALKTRRCSA